MSGAGGMRDPGSGPMHLSAIEERAFQHEVLLPAGVSMRAVARTRGEAEEHHRPLPVEVQLLPLDPLVRRGAPGEVGPDRDFRRGAASRGVPGVWS